LNVWSHHVWVEFVTAWTSSSVIYGRYLYTYVLYHYYYTYCLIYTSWNYMSACVSRLMCGTLYCFMYIACLTANTITHVSILKQVQPRSGNE
jgi:hypothetical protein